MEKVGEKKKPLFRSIGDRDISGTTVEQAGSECDPMKSLEDPPVDWYEPLEEDWEDNNDDAQSWNIDEVKDAEMESLAGESGRNYKGRGGGAVGKRKRKWQFGSVDGWEDCPVLGEGWKRKVVLRRSGVSVGQRDVYYLSPKGERVRSKIELLKYIRNTLDLTNFDFKTGIFVDGEPQKKGIKKSKMDHSSPADCVFSSESSFYNEAAEGYDGTYSPGPPKSLNHFAQQRLSPPCVSSPGASNENLDQAIIIQPAASTRQTVTLKVPDNLEDRPVNNPSSSCFGFCIRCRNSFTSIEEQTMCEKCSKACNASKDNRNITFRKWLPCGFCQACQLTEDCGVCASCRNGKLNPQYRRPVRCHKRKCLCPSLKVIRIAGKNLGDKNILFYLVLYFCWFSLSPLILFQRRADDVLSLSQCDSVVHRPERLETINMIFKPSLPDFKESQFSDSDDRSSFYEDNNSEELLRKCQRSCGRCKGCVAKSDCGTCDYCIDKPKFGGSNKKRQKCRQRQCQREAMGWTAPGRPGLHYAYSLKVMRKNRGIWDLDFSDNECEKERITQNSVVGMRFVDKDKNCVSDYNGQGAKIEESQAHSEEHLLHLFCDEWTRSSDGKWSCPPIIGQHVEQPDENEMKPTITQIFSLGGDNSAVDGLELLELLASLRDAPLPMLWCAVLVEGPHLQLLQCSKLSAMADTMVQIEPSFRYHISVQGEPLLPTHRLYHAHPVRLTSVAQVAILLEDLERYSLCQGFKSELPFGSEPIVQVRAATCEFLVLPEDQCCARCKSAQQKH